MGSAEDDVKVSPIHNCPHPPCSSEYWHWHKSQTGERQTSREEHKGYSFVYITYPYRGETSPLLYCTFSGRRNAIVWPSLWQQLLNSLFLDIKKSTERRDKFGILFSALVKKRFLPFKRKCQFYFQRTVPQAAWAVSEAWLCLMGMGRGGTSTTANRRVH